MLALQHLVASLVASLELYQERSRHRGSQELCWFSPRHHGARQKNFCCSCGPEQTQSFPSLVFSSAQQNNGATVGGGRLARALEQAPEAGRDPCASQLAGRVPRTSYSYNFVDPNSHGLTIEWPSVKLSTAAWWVLAEWCWFPTSHGCSSAGLTFCLGASWSCSSRRLYHDEIIVEPL